MQNQLPNAPGATRKSWPENYFSLAGSPAVILDFSSVLAASRRFSDGLASPAAFAWNQCEIKGVGKRTEEKKS